MTGDPTTWQTIGEFYRPANTANSSCPIYAVGGINISSTFNLTSGGALSPLPASLNTTAIFAQLPLNSSIVGYITTLNATNKTDYYIPPGHTGRLLVTPDMQCFDYSVPDCVGNSMV